MSKEKVSLPSGFRDFSPSDVYRRRFIFSTLERIFEQHGYQPIETPAMERLSTLSGKYGEEGEQLLFKVLNSGEFLDDETVKVAFERYFSDPEPAVKSRQLGGLIAEKALRYDLTVPFARYVVQHRNTLTFPFKRYQIQNVWRADRPQKGRYREFYQCDVDIIGSESIVCEAELTSILDKGLTALGINNYIIRINHRKLLAAIAQALNAAHMFVDLCTAIDKLDKIGWDGVKQELLNRAFTEEQASMVLNLYKTVPTGVNNIRAVLESLKPHLQTTSPVIEQAYAELTQLDSYLNYLGVNLSNVALDLTLARGLNYYTGCIFEVTKSGFSGSIGGGGRYDDLTGMFGLKGIAGIGVSFGADRIFDILSQTNDNHFVNVLDVLIINFGEPYYPQAFSYLKQLQDAGIKTELYPDPVKLAKQFTYADKRQARFCLIYGANEASVGLPVLKNMQTGEQFTARISEHIAMIRA